MEFARTCCFKKLDGNSCTENLPAVEILVEIDFARERINLMC